MEEIRNITDDNRDYAADETIQKCFDLKCPKSFFLFAGAGSGKTKSLVTALDHINSTIGRTLRLNGRKVAVITYTNAARDEINRRVQYNSLFEISTIHSFAWNLIAAHTSDIREWIKNDINFRISETTQKQAASKRTDTKAYRDRAQKLVEYNKRLEFIDTVKRFIYNPDGVNIENNSLDHAEVIRITADILRGSEILQNILIDKYPILLIDESQDTKKELMDVFLQIQSKYPSRFTIGLLGDMMQRIYPDGKENLQSIIPDDWERPLKVMNHRSQKRIVDLCNAIRLNVDGIQQQARLDKQNGTVRIFVTNSTDPYATEQIVFSRMAQIASDEDWLASEKVKCLTIEHKMAAKRLGFNTFFEPLNSVSSYKQGLMNGTLSSIGLFTHILLPFYKADMVNNQYEKMRIIKENSVLFQEQSNLLTHEKINQLNEDIDTLSACWQGNDPTCMELLRIVCEKSIFPIHKDLKKLIENPPSVGDDDYDKLCNLELALQAKFPEVECYYKYIMGNANFDTHQGVKGLEFERVMVIIDDSAARGTTFNYNKLFGLEEKSAVDIQNEQDGKETTLDRTRRLLYVTCSRAISSLAIVYYTPNVNAASTAILNTEWFNNDEIIVL